MAMDLTALARAVADRTGLSREEAADMTRAVLDGIGDQISAGEAKHLVSDLPGPLGAEVAARRRSRPEAHPVAIHEFITQVSARTGQPERDARAGVGAVLGALRDQLAQADYAHLTGQLPAGYTDLATAGSTRAR